MRSVFNSIEKDFTSFYNPNEFSLPLEKFMAVETILTILAKVCPNGNPQKGFLLLAGYNIIATTSFSKMDYLLQNLRRALREYRSKKIWQDSLKKYLGEEFGKIRLYNVNSEGQLECNLCNDLPYNKRATSYIRCIEEYEKQKIKPQYALRGEYYYNKKTFDNTGVQRTAKKSLCIDESVKKQENNCSATKGKREEIRITIKDLLKTAEEMEDIDKVFLKVLSKNKYKSVDGNSVTDTDAILINGLTNIVGMVGAGKSTFVKVLAVALCRKGHKLVIVTDTVYEVFKLYDDFSKFGIKCSPLIGRSDRLKYANQIIKDRQMFLPSEISKYLSGACIVDGFDYNENVSSMLGEEPCFSLRKNNSKSRYVCPYYERCPNSLMQRDALMSDLVITTDAGFAKTRIGADRNLFLESVLEQADLVIYDECDRVQKKFDESFSPDVEFNRFNSENSNDIKKYCEMATQERLESPSFDFNNLQLLAPIVLSAVVEATQKELGAWKREAMSQTFSSLTLLYDLVDKKKVTEEAFEDIYQLLIDRKCRNRDLFYAMEHSCDPTKESIFTDCFDKWFIDALESTKNSCAFVLKNQLKLILKLIYFDHFVKDIECAYNEITDFANGKNELFSFLGSRFSRQQDYLPSSLIGNLFGLKLNADKELILFRQYAYGRVLLTQLAHLNINSRGEPMGPHTLLLSGSSWAPGAYEYHVNAEVNYIIEADDSKRKVLEGTKFVNLQSDIRVSGSGANRTSNLEKLTEKTFPIILSELDMRGGKVLLIVNSYEEAERVYYKIAQLLIDNDSCYTAVAMTRDTTKDDSDKYIKRGEIYRFDKHPAKILIAPAIAIERGHNIVDDYGHTALSSVFFLVRPMSVPDDVSQKGMKLNGHMAEMLFGKVFETSFNKADYVRAEATKYWKVINEGATRSLSYLPKDLMKDVTATLFVLILQIFGRLARITDLTKSAPTIYFADGAFSGNVEFGGYDAIKEIEKYLGELMNDEKYGEVAKTLYEPFYKAFKGEIL